MARVAGSKGYYQIGMLTHDGKPTGLTWQFDSVTTVLDVISKPSLMHWYYLEGIRGVSELLGKYGQHMPTDVDSIKSLLTTEKLSPYSKRDTAAKSGTSIHGELEKLCEGKTITRTPQTEGILNWWEARGLTPNDVIATEQPLVSFKYRVAGTFDVMYRDPESGKVVIADLKTGKHIAWTHFVQGEAYKLMAEECTELGTFDYPVIDEVSVIHVRPTDPTLLGPKEKPLADGWNELRAPEIGPEAFISALELYRSLPVKWKPENMDTDRVV